MKEIQKVVCQEASVSERDLNELDKRINSIVSAHRKQQVKAPSQASIAGGADARSHYSSAKRSVVRSHTEADSLVAIDCDQ